MKTHVTLSTPAALLLAALACAHPETKAEAKADPQSPAAAPDAGTSEAKALAAARAEVPPLTGEEVLLAQPSLAPLADFAAPVPALHTLASGLRVYIVERPGAATETIALVVKRGATADPPGRAGLASLSAAMLEAGSAGKSQAEVAQAVDAIGASLRTSATTDATLVSLSGTAPHLLEMAPLLAEVALRPDLLAAEFSKAQSHRVAELQAELAEPRVAAGHAFVAALYGDSPLGRPALGTPASVQAITLADVKQFLAGFTPENSALVAVGGAPAAEVLAALGAQFAGWRAVPAVVAKEPAHKPGKHDRTHPKPMHEARVQPPPSLVEMEQLAPLPAAQRPRFVFVDFKGRPQTVVRVGLPGVPRGSPDVLALRLLNSVLGGSFTSRLNQNLREKHGYTYGAASNFAFGRGPGPFAALSSVKTGVTGPALSEMLQELNRAASEPLGEEELAKGKALLAYQLVETLQHADGTAAAVAEIFLDDLPLDEYATFVPRLRAITAGDVLAAARRTLKPGELTIAMAGDEAAVLPQLAAVGLTLPAPEQRDALGEKIAAAEKK